MVRFWKATNWGVRFTIVAFLALLVFMVTSFFFDKRMPEAPDYMWLPKSARVVSVRPGDWGGADIEFTMPSVKHPEKALDMIWTGNVSIPITTTEKFSRWAYDGDWSYSLDYDEATKVYRYSASPDK